MAVSRRAAPICYLCGKAIDEKPSDDHVPPCQLYASIIRKTHNPNLLTLPAHESCNTSYQKDEDYFVASVGPFAYETYSGAALILDTRRRLAHERKLHPEIPGGGSLTAKVLAEFEMRPGGLHLPSGRVLKRFEGERIGRVLWKIVRGLFFHEHRRFLPLDTPRTVWVQFPGDEREPVLTETLLEDGRGQYAGVFDYKFRRYPEMRDFHVWALLFWNRLIAAAAFHDPDCGCEKCLNVPADDLAVLYPETLIQLNETTT